MARIEAFVGHSFTDGDAAVNQAFLEYFSVIAKSYPTDFRWEHAFDASPDDVGAKVLTMLEGKNTFIGICTKKERVIQDRKLKRGQIFKKRRYANDADFEWKTSDWVIQEIGIAAGRNLKIILLLEAGLRLPGGIQGNLEYIEFSRDRPEASFLKLLQMIRAAVPVDSTGQTTATMREVKDDSEISAFDKSLLPLEIRREPQSDWKKEDYVDAVIRADPDRTDSRLLPGSGVI